MKHQRNYGRIHILKKQAGMTAEEYRGFGYATEALETILEWAFDQPGVTTVAAETGPDNLASQRVLEKCGFTPTGIMGKEGPRFIKDQSDPSYY